MNSPEELELSTFLRFRVTPIGNRKLDFLDLTTEGEETIIKVRSTRPASVQEQAMWDHMLGLREQLTKLGWSPDGGVPGGKEFLPGGGGVGAAKVRDSLGNALPEPRDRPDGT